MDRDELRDQVIALGTDYNAALRDLSEAEAALLEASKTLPEWDRCREAYERIMAVGAAIEAASPALDEEFTLEEQIEMAVEASEPFDVDAERVRAIGRECIAERRAAVASRQASLGMSPN